MHKQHLISMLIIYMSDYLQHIKLLSSEEPTECKSICVVSNQESPLEMCIPVLGLHRWVVLQHAGPSGDAKQNGRLNVFQVLNSV